MARMSTSFVETRKHHLIHWLQANFLYRGIEALRPTLQPITFYGGNVYVGQELPARVVIAVSKKKAGEKGETCQTNRKAFNDERTQRQPRPQLW